VVVIAFSGFDERVTNYCYTGMFELATKLKLDFGLKDGRIISCFLQSLHKILNFSFDFGGLDF
jgi:hypothetical protein